MPVLKQLIDVVTMGSEKPMRRLLAYYGILAIIVLILAYFFPVLLQRLAAKGLGEVSEGPTVLTDALNASASSPVGFGAGSFGDLAITTVFILLGTVALMLPVTWVYMSARPIPGHNQAIVQTLIFLPLVVAGIVFIVQNSLALAFSLAGVMAAVRFRTTLRDTRDVVYIFLSIVVGFAAGVQALAVGALISIMYNLILLITWRYDYGRNVLQPSAASNWAGPLHTLASGVHEIPDRDLVLSLTPEKAGALADRFDRVRNTIGKKNKKPRYNAVLSIRTYHVPELQERLEPVLNKMTKRWKLDEVVTNTGRPSEIYYLLRLKKSVPRDDLLTGVHQAGEGMIDTADIETGEAVEDKERAKA
jgi:uncharacterized protein DUF4956